MRTGFSKAVQALCLGVLLLSAGLALLLSWLAIAVNAAFRMEQDINTRLSTLARATALNSQAAMAFGDAREASQILHSLRADTSIAYVCCLVDRDNQIFASVAFRQQGNKFMRN